MTTRSALVLVAGSLKELPSGDVLAGPTVQGSNADAHRVDVNTFGFLNQTETTIAFDDGTNTFTLAPTGTSCSYYRAGVKYTITGAKSCVLSAATALTVIHFVYIDATDGTLSTSTAPWTLDAASTKVPVATVARNSACTPTYLLGEERHSCLISRRDHWYLHATRGTVYSSGAALTGPTVGSSTNANKTVAVTAAGIFDEDIYTTTAAISAGNGSTDAFYTIAYRTSATTWAWARSVVPFKYAGAGAIEWDSNGTMTASGVGSGSAARYVNYYMLCNNIKDQESVLWVPGRTAFTSASLAYAEDFASFNIVGFPSVEAAAVWKFTWDTNGTGLGLCRLARTPVRVNSNILTSTSVVAGVHNGLAGIQGGAVDDYQHLTSAQLAALTGGGTSLDGGSSTSTYLTSQAIDGGSSITA